ncbi:unnamed protein product [Albugo candida]|uniref:Uncharacterized protein n=1 Tax=Albugo candida TaxID=65357 RepID=A0A024FUT8_9STRA|nr:unnamed protein product [Albugo candida]|eukprot:CCI10913.1 unnamed protein product [Albugo candida]
MELDEDEIKILGAVKLVLEVKDLGEVTEFLDILDIDVTYAKDTGYLLEQTQCIREVLARLCLKQANSSRALLVEEQDGEDNGDFLPGDDDGTPEWSTLKMFQSVIGSLHVVVRRTRTDIRCAPGYPASKANCSLLEGKRRPVV